MTVYIKYGETFKKLRKQRGFKLNQFGHLGISSAALCKFERGNSMLKFDSLILALSELSVTLSEYEKCLNNYDLDDHEVLIQEMIIANITNNHSEISAEYEKALNLKEKELALAIKGLYASLNSDEIETLADYFEKIDFWRHTDLYTLYLSIDWLELPQIPFIIEGFFLVNLEVLNSIEHRTRVAHIVCRAAMVFISKKHEEMAKHLLNYLSTKNYKHTMFTRNLYKFVKGYWLSEFVENDEGVILMRETFKYFDELSYPEISKYYKRLYEKYSHKKFPEKLLEE